MDLHRQTKCAQVPCRLVQLAIGPQARRDLDGAIDTRFGQMLADGFLDEVSALRARGDLSPDLPALRAVGYRQAWLHLDGPGDVRQLAAEVGAATRQLAKRQYTWLRSWPDLQWLSAPHPESVALSFNLAGFSLGIFR